MKDRPLRIGMIAPVSHPFPPPGYGPWERVCHDLTEGLVELGHQVFVFAPGGSSTSGVLMETLAHSLAAQSVPASLDARVWEEYHVAAAIRESLRLGVDVIHSHLHVHALGYAPLVPMPLVTTLHGSAWDENNHIMLRAYGGEPFVSLSESERSFLPDLNYIATVGNGIRLSDFEPGGDAGDRLVFVGRMAPEKAPDLAIDVARAAGRELVLVGAVEDKHRSYFEERVGPALAPGRVDFLGALSRAEVNDVVGASAALLMPLRWDEPFGLVVAESLALGTPVVAWRRGAMPELVREGVTGFLVDDVGSAAHAVARIAAIDRGRCRREAVERFGHLTMARGYVEAYRRSIAGSGWSSGPQSIPARRLSNETVASLIPVSEKP